MAALLQQYLRGRCALPEVIEVDLCLVEAQAIDHALVEFILGQQKDAVGHTQIGFAHRQGFLGHQRGVVTQRHLLGQALAKGLGLGGAGL